MAETFVDSRSDFACGRCYKGRCDECDGWVSKKSDYGVPGQKCHHYCRDQSRGRGQGSRFGDTDYG